MADRRSRNLGRLAIDTGTQLLVGLVLMLTVGSSQAAEQPSEAMLEPVRGLVAFMTTLRPGEHPAVFARHGLCIVENFPPFLFCGASAAADWEAGFRAHALDGQLSELAVRFGAAEDFLESGERAYFSLPTTWTGRTRGRPFEEHGAWSFVLLRAATGWRILAYGWGVTDESATEL